MARILLITLFLVHLKGWGQIDTVEVGQGTFTILTFPSPFDFSANAKKDFFIESFPEGTASQTSQSVIFLTYTDLSKAKRDFTTYTVYTKDGFAYDFILKKVDFPTKGRWSMTRENADNFDDITAVSSGAKMTIFKEAGDDPIEVRSPAHHYETLQDTEGGLELSNKKGNARKVTDELYRGDRPEYIRSRCYYNQFENFNVTKHMTRKGNISLWLKGVYYDKEEIYFQFRLENDSGIDYDVNFLKSYLGSINDNEAKENQIPFSPEFRYKLPKRVMRKTENYFFLVYDKFSPDKDNSLILEINEQKGGRHLRLPIPHSMILKAKSFSE